MGINRLNILAHEYGGIWVQIIILGIYASNEDKNTLTKNEFHEKLNEVIVWVGGKRELIITARDLNGRTGRRNDDLQEGNLSQRKACGN